MKKAALLAAAAILYAVAAWTVAPGFYDGFTPPQPYNFVCPPPQVGANQQPTSGHLVVKVIGGVSDANSAFTDDGQVVIGFLPGSFNVKPGQMVGFLPSGVWYQLVQPPVCQTVVLIVSARSCWKLGT